MKKNIIYLLVLFMVSAVCCVSCNDEWKDEQYEQLVSFKAEPDANGVTMTNIRYNPDGKVTYNLPIIISGSTSNSQHRTVHIAIDPDTLNKLNVLRYGHRESLYFKQLDSKYYTFPETVEIPAGQSTAVLPIEFTLAEDLDQSDKWVLPLTIEDSPSYNYQANPNKYYRKALLRISPFNDYSGTYGSSLTKILLENFTTSLGVAETRSFVVNDTSIFVYAGSRNIDSEDRKDYKVFIEFTDEKIDLFSKKLKVKTDNSLIKLTLNGEQSYSVDSVMDKVKPYLKHKYISLNLSYNFVDYSTSPGKELHYKVEGSMMLQRDLNTLIPDEDQQIQW